MFAANLSFAASISFEAKLSKLFFCTFSFAANLSFAANFSFYSKLFLCSKPLPQICSTGNPKSQCQRPQHCEAQTLQQSSLPCFNVSSVGHSAAPARLSARLNVATDATEAAAACGCRRAAAPTRRAPAAAIGGAGGRR